MAQMVQGPSSSLTNSTKVEAPSPQLWDGTITSAPHHHILLYQQDTQVSWDFSSENKVRNKIRFYYYHIAIYLFI